MLRKHLLRSVLSFLLAATPSLAGEPAPSKKRVDEAIAQSQKQRPCGEYVNPGSLFPRLVFGDGHKVWVLLSAEPQQGELTDARLRAWVALDGKVKVRNDKGHFLFTLESAEALKGEDTWTQGGTWKRVGQPKKACAPLGATEAEKKELAAEICEMDIVSLQRDGKLDAALALGRSCCDSGAASSCDRTGQLLQLRGSTDARPLYEKACNAGHGRACFNLGNLEKEAGKVGTAKDLYQKGCELGSTDACVAQLDF
jgi:hypothetical protein